MTEYLFFPTLIISYGILIYIFYEFQHKMAAMNGLLKATLILSIISTVFYMIYVMFDGDRRTEEMSKLIGLYSSKPSIDKRVVVVIPCENQKLSQNTLRSLLSQSRRVSDIAVETSNPDLISLEDRRVVTVHKPDTTKLREWESDTIILYARNGDWYEYDFVESKTNEILTRSL
jgi:hypothetical protein